MTSRQFPLPQEQVIRNPDTAVLAAYCRDFFADFDVAASAERGRIEPQQPLGVTGSRSPDIPLRIRPWYALLPPRGDDPV